MKATKKLLLLAFAVALMITMFVAFAVTAAAAETTLDFDTNAVTGEITYGDEYPSVLESAISMYGPSVAKTDVTIALINQSGKVYEPGDPAGTYYLAIVSGKFGGNTEVTNLTYTITSGSFRSQLDLGNGDVLYFNTVAVTVKPKPITVTLTGTVASKVYDGTTTVLAEQVTGLTAEYTGLFGTDTLDTVITGTYAGENVATGIALTLNVALAGEKAGNYTLENPTATTFTADITRRSLTVVLTNPSKVYGEADDLAYTLEGAVAGEIPASDTLLTRDAGQDVGLYTVHTNLIVLKDNGDFLEANYAISAEEVKYEITKKAITVAYDWTGTNFFTFNNNKVFVTITSVVKDQLVEADKAGLTSFEISTSADDADVYVYGDAEKYVNIKPTFNAGYETLFDNYDITYNISLEIKPLEIVVDLKDNITSEYRGEVQSLTDTNSGTFLTYTPAIYGTYSVEFVTTGKDVDDYSFADGTLVLGAISVMDGTEDETPNYSFVVNTASTYVYKINKFAITVTVIDDTKVYDANAYVVDLTTVTVASALFAGDAFTGTITTTFVNAGTYKTSDSTADTTGWTTNLDSNYEITWVVNVEIEKKAVTVTVNASGTYNAEKLTVDISKATLTGAVEGHTLAAGAFMTNDVKAGTYVYGGTLAWTVTTAVVINNESSVDVTANYDITYAGTIEIDPKEITVSMVTIKNARYYNGDTKLTNANVEKITFAGLVGADTTGYTFDSAAWSNRNAGTNTVIINGLVIDNANYKLVTADTYAASRQILPCQVYIKNVVVSTYDRYYNGTTEFDHSLVTEVVLAVADSGTKGKIFDGDALVVSFAENPNHGIRWYSKDAGTNKVHINANSASDKPHVVLSYLKDAGFEGENYVFNAGSYDVPVNADIRPAKLYIVPDANQSKIYGAADQEFGFNYYVEGKELVAKDAENKTYDADNANIAGALSREAGQNVGTYKYLTGTLALNDNSTFKASNYELVLNEETYEIIVRKVTVNPNLNQKKVYWDEYTTYTYTFSFNDNAGVSAITLFTPAAVAQNDIFSGALSRENGENIGEYLITLGDLKVNTMYNPAEPADKKDVQNFEIVFIDTVTFTIVPVELQLQAQNVTIEYGQKPVYKFNVDATNGLGGILAGVTCTNLQSTALSSVVLADGSTVDFKAGFSCAYPNTQTNINAGVYAGMIKFYYEDDATIANSAAYDNVIWNTTKATYGTLEVTKKPIKLVYADVEVVYGTAIDVFEIVAVGATGAEFGFVEGDNFANSFRIDTNEVIHATTYSAGQPVGTYDVKNGINIADQFTSQNYEIVPYAGSAALNATPIEDQIGAGKITVTPKQLVLVPYVGTFDPNNVSALIEKEFGAEQPTIKFAVVGLVGDQVAIWNANITIVDDYGVEINYDGTDAVGTYKFTIADVVLTNNDVTGFFAQNYDLTISDEVKFHIYAATLYLEGVITGDTVKTYNGLLDYVGGFDFTNMKEKNSLSLAGLTFTVNAHFNDKNVGENKELVITSVVCSDANYKVDFSGLTATATIKAKVITATGITANDKVYNANKVATIFIPNNIADVFAGYILGDDLTVTATGTFDEKNVGERTVTIVLALGGTDAANYELGVTTLEDTAVITPAPIIITGITAKDKVYNGLVDIEFVVNAEEALIGFYEGDDIFVNVAGEFADANVGNKKKVPITVTLTGGDAGNYVVNAAEGQTYVTASITPATITITLGDVDKEYGYEVKVGDFSYTASAWAEANTSTLYSVLTFDYTTTYDAANAAKRGVGKYAIDATNIKVETYDNTNTLVSTENYIVVVEKGDLLITAAVLEIKVNTPAAITYGDDIPTYTFYAEGYKFDDTIAVVKGTPVFNCNYVKGADAGTYLIALASNLYADNYVLHFNSAILTVNKATLTITPADTTITYGEAAKCDDFIVDGLVNNDAESVIRGEIVYIFEGFEDANGVVGTYTIKVDEMNTTFTANNYNFVYATGTLTVEKATLTIKPNDATAVYGNAFVNNGYTFVGLVNGDTTVELSDDVNYAVDYVVGDDVGTYVITAVVDGLTTDNYVIVAGEGTLTVTKANLTIKPYAKDSITYGDLAPAQDFYYYDAVAGLIDGDVLAEQVTGTAAYTTDYQQNSNAGKYNIYVTGLEAKNYEITYVEGTLTVDKKALTVKPVDTTITFGDEPTCVGYTLVGLTPYDNAITELNALVGFTGELTYSYTYKQYMTVGNYVITSVIDAIESTNYYFETADATLTVEAYKLNGYITANGETVLNIVYGTETPAYAVVLDAASQLVADGAANSTYNTNDIVFVFDGYVEGDYVGEYTVTVALNGTENFVIEVIAPATVNVAKRNITITADDINVEYGDEPAYTISFGDMGLADCDTIVIDGKVFINPERTHIVVNNKFTTNYSETDPAGTTYLILMGLYTFESENYNVVAKYDGKLTVVKRVIDVTLNEVDVIYGNDIDFTKFTYAVEHERFVEGDDFATIFGIAVENLYTKITSNYVAGTVIADAGKVTYTLDGVTADNYVINFNYEGTVIAQREITLTINDFTVVYGDEPNQEGQFTLGDKFGTDVVDVTLVYGGYEKGVANAGETFEITATITNVNYTLVFEAATLTVTKRAVTITVGDWRAMYGVEPSYDFAGAKIEGFFADQGVNYVITSDYIVGNNVGDYVLNIKAEDITAKDGTLLSNYEITVVPGNLEIYQRTFIINVNDATIVYGDEANSKGYGYTEFVMPGMITEDVITGITFKFNTKADGTGEDYKVGSPVGTYYIIAVCEANANYAVFAYAGELTVVPKNVTVTINDSTVEYKQPAAANGYVADGILAEDIAAFEAALKYTFGDYVCDAEKPEYSPAGKYVLSAVLLENYEDAENYNITFVDGTLNVTKIKITITVRVISITYGDKFESNCEATVAEGFEALVTGAPVYTVPEYNTEDANMRGAGDYEVKITGIELVDAENYYIEYVGNTLVVEQYKVTVTANNGTATYADAEAALNGFTIPTLPYGDDISANFSVTSAYEQGVTVAGTYPITVVAEKAELDNYTFTFVEGTLTVSKKVIKFTVANGYISYGDAEPDYEITFEEGAFFGTDTFENDVFGMIDIDAKGYSVGSPVSGSPYIVTVTTYLASEKYDVQYTGNTYLYVAKRTLTIKADDKSVEYGEGYPEFTYTIEGTFAPGEEMADIGVIKFNPTYSYDADSRDAAGTYDINVTFATTLPAISNYDVYFEAGELVVTPKALVITPEDTVMLKGGETPVIKYTYTGVVGDDVVTFYGALGTKATDVENVYDITMGTLVVLSPNYTLVLDKNSTAQFKVLDVTITVDGASVSLKNDVIMNFFFTVNFATGTEIVLSENEWGILQWTEEEYKALESYLFDSEYANYGEMDGHTLKVNGDAVAAKDYSKTYYVRAFVAVENGDETYYVYSDVFAYSVATYGKTVMSNDAFAKERPVVIAMLDYGAAAQKYFNDNSELANSFITDDMREAAGYTGYDESMNPSIDKASKIEGVTYNENLVWYGANASFGETFELYFHGIKIDDSYVISGDDANFGIIYWTEADRVDGKFTLEEGKYHNATVEEGRYGYYVFTVEDIVAREADERIYAAMWVKDAEGNVSYSYVTYTSVKDYAYAMMSLKDNANYDYIVSLGEATIAYIEAAKAYFNK